MLDSFEKKQLPKAGLTWLHQDSRTLQEWGGRKTSWLLYQSEKS